MDIDKSLPGTSPTVAINGRTYHFGKDPNGQHYLVENVQWARDYWAFKDELDLGAFIINSDGVARRDMRINVRPDWRDATPAQREAYLKEDVAALNALMEQDVVDELPRTLKSEQDDDLQPHDVQHSERLIGETESGPRSSESGRHENGRNETPLERLEEALKQFKYSLLPSELTPSHPSAIPDALAEILREAAWDSLRTEANKLRTLEVELDWTGVSDSEKEGVLAREVDFSKIPRFAIDIVYDYAAWLKKGEVDETVGRRLSEQAHAMGELQNLEHYESIYYPIRERQIAPEQLNVPQGDGPMFAELVRSEASYLCKKSEYNSLRNALFPDPEVDRSATTGNSPSPSEIAEDKAEVEAPANDPSRERGNGR